MRQVVACGLKNLGGVAGAVVCEVAAWLKDDRGGMGDAVMEVVAVGVASQPIFQTITGSFSGLGTKINTKIGGITP